MEEDRDKNKKDLPYKVAMNFAEEHVWPLVKSSAVSFYETTSGFLAMPYTVRKIINKETFAQNSYKDNFKKTAKISGTVLGGITALCLAGYGIKTACEMRMNEYYTRPLALELLVAPNLISLGYEMGRKKKKKSD